MLLDSEVLSLAGYLFTHRVSVDNRFGYITSIEYVLSQISDACIVVTISNLYFKGYFPQLKQYNNGEKIAIDMWERGEYRKFNFYQFTDKEVLKLIMQGMSNEEIVEETSSDSYYSLQILQSAIEVELEEFRKKLQLTLEWRIFWQRTMISF